MLCGQMAMYKYWGGIIFNMPFKTATITDMMKEYNTAYKNVTA